MRIAPSVLPADFARLGDDCVALEKAGVDRIQWDVMDGRFVPNLTFGPDLIAAIRPHVAVPFEVHLMVLEPDELAARYVEPAASASSFTRRPARTCTARWATSVSSVPLRPWHSIRPHRSPRSSMCSISSTSCSS